MKSEDLTKAIGEVDEKMIAEADAVRSKKRKPRWILYAAAAACLAIVVAIAKPLWTKSEQKTKQIPLGKPDHSVLYDADSSVTDRLIALAKYPQMAKRPSDIDYTDDYEAYDRAYEEWYADRAAIKEATPTPKNSDYFDHFYRTSAAEFLSGSEDENLVYSPSNVYMALAMLSELTDGQSREQILQLLGTESIEELRTEAKHLWMSNYFDDGTLTTVMANSVWLDDSLPYNQETLTRLAEEYYASSYSGTMGSEEYDALLRDWLNRQTGGLLEDQVKELSFDPRTVMALASTVYFKGQWNDRFYEENTKQQVFHATNGDVTTDFMCSSDLGMAYWGESYTAVEKPMEGGASMWLILPDEGKTVADVLSEGEIFEMTKAGADWTQKKYLQLNLQMPKFDVSSKLDLVGSLQKLGVRDIFDYAVSDFTPMSSDLENVYVDKVEHAARVMVDEKGCTAAAYTVIMIECGAAICEDELDFVLDRPFLFVITGCGDQPLFIGIVNQV